MSVEDDIKEVIRRDGVAHLTLIDPASQHPTKAREIAEAAVRAGTDGFMVGGSTGSGGAMLD